MNYKQLRKAEDAETQGSDEEDTDKKNDNHATEPWKLIGLVAPGIMEDATRQAENEESMGPKSKYRRREAYRSLSPSHTNEQGFRPPAWMEKKDFAQNNLTPEGHVYGWNWMWTNAT